MSLIAKQVASVIIEKQCCQFRFVEGGTLILYFATKGIDTAGTRLWIDCPWRLRDGPRVAIGSMDESESVLQVLQSIVGCEVEGFTVDGNTGDFQLALSKDHVLETFGHTTIDELWELREKSGLRLGIGPESKPFERYEDAD